MALGRNKPRKTRLQLGLETQSTALSIFDEVLGSLDESDDLLSSHQERNDAITADLQAQIVALQNEHNAAATALEKNARVRAAVQGFLGA